MSNLQMDDESVMMVWLLEERENRGRSCDVTLYLCQIFQYFRISRSKLWNKGPIFNVSSMGWWMMINLKMDNECFIQDQILIELCGIIRWWVINVYGAWGIYITESFLVLFAMNEGVETHEMIMYVINDKYSIDGWWICEWGSNIGWAMIRIRWWVIDMGESFLALWAADDDWYAVLCCAVQCDVWGGGCHVMVAMCCD